MATDGVKIIDGDTAFDLYATFTDAYNQGADGAALRKMYEQDKVQCSFDESEYEICVTVYALAFWEIGELTPEILREVENVIAKGAGVADWTEQVGEKAGKERQKELDKLLTKISKPNPKIRKRKKYSKVTNLIFETGDVLVFQLPDQTYGLTIVADIIQYRGECDYMFCRTTFNSVEKPTLQHLADCRICGSLVPTGSGGGINQELELSKKMANLTADEIGAGALNQLMDGFLASLPKLKMPWVITVEHQKLKNEDYRGHFEKIGNVQLRNNCSGSRSAISYQSFCEDFYVRDTELRNDLPGMPATGEFTIEELGEQPYQP